MGREKETTKVAYTVEQLVAFNRYNPDILPDLENYVNDQVPSPSLFSISNSLLLPFFPKSKT